MADYTIVDEDQIIWLPNFGKCITMGNPQGKVKASAATVKVTQKKPALVGDELTWKSMPIPYNEPPYMGGTGYAMVVALHADQKTKTVTCEDKAVIIKGSFFDAKFVVTSPAMAPGTPPQPDKKLVKQGGKGKFINSNQTVKMT